MALTDTKINIPIVSAIIERVRNGKIEVLVQTRWKPNRDPIYSGTLEIPAGSINEYESVYDALKREVFEETGLTVTRIKPDGKVAEYKTDKNDSAIAFRPFCCQQQLKGGLPWIGLVFICEVADTEPVAQEDEVRDIRWLERSQLEKIFRETPEKIFTIQLGVLAYYFSHVE